MGNKSRVRTSRGPVVNRLAFASNARPLGSGTLVVQARSNWGLILTSLELKGDNQGSAKYRWSLSLNQATIMRVKRQEYPDGLVAVKNWV